ncbi:Ribosomal lysine N-methyltransferase 3 [Neolecta irregularis DAH-3]|uniref:Ribosomal lysine N-methyltransferase 3 n=1 Tax=Neolecta irregularis (strain DAH-3) TaxID=1198029 RepID=A0A1U7LGS4_NEOID|nr:Ribosomal lysine N-methyltransferase 3 [Neolecta irregularis DAH-3]|eukprot:OLL21860.1 Ribosomal lysine N-methyltransferase 3 [Neolecta irregularis DAH-3]
MNDHDSTLSKFISWLQRNKIFIHPQIKLVQDDENNKRISVYATVTPPELNQIILKIPKSLVLCPRNSDIAYLLDSFKIKKEIVRLCLTFMYEKARGRESFWSEYVDVLPDFERIPRLWRDQEKELLKGTEVAAIRGLDETDLLKTWEKFIQPVFNSCRLFSNTALFNYTFFIKCMSVVYSRCFEIDEYRPLALVPFADLLNHTCFEETVHFVTCFDVCGECGRLSCHCNDKKHGSDDPCINDDTDLDDPCEMVVVTRVEPHSEILNTYGDLGNDVLVSRYGFAIPDNPHDTVSILPADIFSQINGDRKSLWTRHGNNIITAVVKDFPSLLPTNTQEFPLNDRLNIKFNGEPSFELVCLLFLSTVEYSCSGTDYTPLTKTMRSFIQIYLDIRSSTVPPLCRPILHSAFKKLLKCLDDRGSRYLDTSLTWHDYDYLLVNASFTLDYNKRIAFTVLRNEKKILEKCRDLCNFIQSRCE